MNIFDKLITFFSPSAGVRRARDRIALDFYSRKFEGASTGRRTDGWITPSTNANTELKGALVKLRDRSRDLSRNNPIASRALQVITSNTVGTGIVGQHKASTKELAMTWDQLWSSWAETSAIDQDGRLDIYGIQSLIMRSIAEAGEVLIRKIPQPSSAGLPVPLKIQVLEPDFLDSAKDEKLSNGGMIVQGVEIDASGRRVAYWLFPAHPGSGSGNQTSARVPADQVIHAFRPDRAGQLRGYPWAAPVMIRLKDCDDFMDAMLVRQKIAACFTAFVSDIESPLDSTSAARALGEKLEPGVIEILPPGKDIKFATPPGADGSGEFIASTLRQIAAAYGITYEAMTNDYSRVNYSSGRMGWIEMSRNVQSWQWQIMISQVCAPLWGWFRDAAVLTGARAEGVSMSWTPPRREMIDPSKEISATINAIRGGLMSISEAHRQSGFNSDALLEEIALDNSKIDALGLILDSDARKTMKAGVAQTYVDGVTEPDPSMLPV